MSIKEIRPEWDVTSNDNDEERPWTASNGHYRVNFRDEMKCRAYAALKTLQSQSHPYDLWRG